MGLHLIFCPPSGQRAVTRLKNVRHLNMEKNLGSQLSHTQP